MPELFISSQKGVFFLSEKIMLESFVILTWRKAQIVCLLKYIKNSFRFWLQVDEFEPFEFLLLFS